jgi:hypothetical protein
VQVTGEGDQGVFDLQTLHGSVRTEAGTPLAGVNVMLTDWRTPDNRDASWAALGGLRSWGDTDDQGLFAIPSHLPEDFGPLEIELELTTVHGQTLETVVLTIDPQAGLDLGVLTAPDPAVLDAEFAETVSE